MTWRIWAGSGVSGKPFEDDGLARRIFVKSRLSEIAGGTLAPRTVVGLVTGNGWSWGQPTVLNHVVALMDAWDDMPQQRDVTEHLDHGPALQALTDW